MLNVTLVPAVRLYKLPPSATPLMVELARLALVMPAVPLRLVLVIPLSVPPNVKLPVTDTVPLNVNPLTEPVPLTLVTVPSETLPDHNKLLLLTVLIVVPLTNAAADVKVNAPEPVL